MLNKWIGIGRLTKTVELRYTTNGNATCSFTLACERPIRGQNGEKETDFINIAVPPFRGKLAELCANYLDSGKLAAVEGSVQTRNYTDQNGTKHYVTEIIAENVRFLSPKDRGNHSETPNSSIGTEVPLSDEIPF